MLRKGRTFLHTPSNNKNSKIECGSGSAYFNGKQYHTKFRAPPPCPTATTYSVFSSELNKEEEDICTVTSYYTSHEDGDQPQTPLSYRSVARTRRREKNSKDMYQAPGVLDHDNDEHKHHYMGQDDGMTQKFYGCYDHQELKYASATATATAGDDSSWYDALNIMTPQDQVLSSNVSSDTARAHCASSTTTFLCQEVDSIDPSQASPFLLKKRENLRNKPAGKKRFKTEMCKKGANCEFFKNGQVCNFAHSLSELRDKDWIDKNTYRKCPCFDFVSTGSW